MQNSEAPMVMRSLLLRVALRASPASAGSAVRSFADSVEDALEALVDVAEPVVEGGESLVQRRELLECRVLTCGGPLLLGAADESAGDGGRDDRDEGEPAEQEDRSHSSTRGRRGDDVPVADGRHGLQRPPHPEPDRRELVPVDEVLEDPP